ncbi:hypothetical protein P3T76_015285 [Phytophthora citrophthora]|uniref:Uncharacterized protein n=1 Tax=Phytophthora citrophthora TaxID=4793 RepID=A0AAD9G0A6_9STRA|nr:hypothetical protein P3T76_015285 [Phytophthora citrophthora]
MKDMYVIDQDIMYVTLFYTSHPDDLAPRNVVGHKNERITREIALLRELAVHFVPIRMVPVKVVLASSGAILMLFQCVLKEDEGSILADLKVKNAGRRAEFGFDLLLGEGVFPMHLAEYPTTLRQDQYHA